MYFKDGRKAVEHPKNIQLVRVEDVWICNLHLHQLRLFGLDYNDGNLGEALAKEVEKTFLNLPQPLILTGDFNFEYPENVYITFIREYNLKQVAWEDRDTDHTFYSSQLMVVEQKMIETKSDHNLHIVTFQL